MAKQDELLARIEAAMERIRVAAQGVQKSDAGEGDAGEMDRLKQRHSALSDELKALKAQRKADVQEIDALVAQLKPLVGEV